MCNFLLKLSTYSYQFFISRKSNIVESILKAYLWKRGEYLKDNNYRSINQNYLINFVKEYLAKKGIPLEKRNNQGIT